jgi:hypothetical protein
MTDDTRLQVQLNRFDLFHGHLFVTADGTPGMLLHASEFPAECKAFPFSLGFCQTNSTLQFSSQKVDWRNYLWYEVSFSSLTAAKN